MKFRQTLWDRANRDHILWDGTSHPDREIFEEDVDEVVLSSGAIEMDSYEQGGEPRIDLMGETSHGRLLFVTIAPKPLDAARPVAARDATDAEASYYAARRKVKR